MRRGSPTEARRRGEHQGLLPFRSRSKIDSPVWSATRWTAPIGLFDKMRRAAMIDLLREEVGSPSAENCASIKKKADLAVNVSERLPAHWLPAPMRIGAFDLTERNPEDFDADMDEDDTEQEDVTDEGMA